MSRSAEQVPVAASPTTAWFHPATGIAGDMALGALLDAGAELGFVTEQLQTLELDGWRLDAERVTRHQIAATRALVEAPESHHHRRWREIRVLLESAPLAERVRRRALAVFGALADAEGAVHGVAAEEVHFHEVGALDAIVDIVGVCAALESLDVKTVCCGPVAVGTGTITAAHGVLPNPPPAVTRLLAGRPIVGIDLDAELTTPTGAAIVSALAERFGPAPAMTVTATGFGAGARDLPDRANVTGVLIGTAADPDDRSDPGDMIAAATVHAAADEVAVDSAADEVAAGAPAADEVAADSAAAVAPAAAAPAADALAVSAADAPMSALRDAMSAVTGADTVSDLVELVVNLDDVTGEVLAHAVETLLAQGALDAWVAPIVMKKGRPAHTLSALCRPPDVTRLAEAIARLTGTLGMRARPVVRTELTRRTSTARIGAHDIAVKHGPHASKPEWDDVIAAARSLGLTPAQVTQRLSKPLSS